MKDGGPEYAQGDRVRLLRLSDEFLSGLPEEDVAELNTLIGREWTVEEWHEELGQLEISNALSQSATIHFAWVPPEWVERIR
ncbi:hypothetical protein BFX40_02765 [Mesorhizobium sp. SEMIA 3007]|nr:hypothetical protein BFX40_02765 [Mesorhizobium sp. SEMIA 3007]QKD07829.1 hypothetical protein EFV37_06100 [Mesorhizobium loti]BCG99272.1 hypothetical protein MesoLj131b_12720 [Mesorhizobium sp. 131-2-5]BCH06913.1 hypothetical protein MesoLj131c_11710 [Mesorhizobium sp. 131-3-5]